MRDVTRNKSPFFLILLLFVLPLLFFFVQKTFSAGETSVMGYAQSKTTGNLIFLSSDTYGANIKISDPDSNDNNSRIISGYAWSEDVGWIKFTSGETSGVKVVYSTGKITGQAYVVNTGGILDFDNYNSETIINPSTGAISGYVWSEDIGWIEFNPDHTYVKDSKKPSNVSSISGYDSSEKKLSFLSSEIYNIETLYFEWVIPNDPQDTAGYASGITEYYVYFGTDSTAIPSVSGTLQSANNFTYSNLSTGNKYYLRIQPVDAQGNIFTGTVDSYTKFEYSFDKTAPKNISYVVTPNGSFSNVNEIFFNWPSSGSQASDDEYSGVLGWQYSLNDVSSWTGTTHNDRLNIDYIPLQNSTYNQYLNSERDGANMITGNNIIYFRTVDKAGNASSYVSGALAYSGEAPVFPAGSSVTVTPDKSTSNEFSLSWPTATTTTEGRTVSKYYYVINTPPPNSYETLTSNGSLYIPVNGNSVTAQMLRGSIKGKNTVYIVAVDNQGGYSASNSIQGTYELNSTLPDPVQNLTVADSSIKEAELWRASLSWDVPIYKGDGNLTYIIERSDDGTTWTNISETTGISYTDIVEKSDIYYYRIGAKDSTDPSKLNPTYSQYVSATLQGRFTAPAQLVSGIIIRDISTKQAVIDWVTKRESDSKLMYGIETGKYFVEELYNSQQVTEHTIRLNNLEAETLYYFKVKWTDIDGNTGISQEVSFRTNPRPTVTDFVVNKVGLNYAMVSFTVDGASKVSVVYGKNESYGGIKEINTSIIKSRYTVMLSDLSDGTLYNYKFKLTDSDGFIYDSLENHTFTTPPMPKISKIHVEEVREVASPTVKFDWESNTGINSIITYYIAGKANKAMDKVDVKIVKGLHEMTITGLAPDTKYVAVIEGVDNFGNRVVSDAINFTTLTDTRPPIISNTRVEGTLLSSSIQSNKERSAQLIVSWETDEPSDSRVEYGEGSTGLFTSSTQTDQELRTKHTVIISGLTPSKVYHLNIVSKDIAGNMAEYSSLIAITPRASETVLNTVLGSIFKIFSFL